ncbi:MAG TPA: hypothetical protein VK171_09860 [Fimbriimonas sp.]|nr:hypothetical protein [Fimbriimonas sp.]
MRISGRVNFLALGAILMVGLMVAAVLLAKETPQTAAVNFMDALARHDVKKLTELSYIGESDPAAAEAKRQRLEKDWDYSVNDAGRHFTFTWRVTAANATTERTATATVQMTPDAVLPSSYEQKFDLPMEKEGGKWKVDVGGMSKLMFPALPN